MMLEVRTAPMARMANVARQGLQGLQAPLAQRVIPEREALPVRLVLKAQQAPLARLAP